MWIPNRYQGVLGEQHHGVGTLQLHQRIDQPVHEGPLTRAGEHVQHDLCVRGGVEDAASLLQLVPQQAGIDQIAVVRDAHLAIPIPCDERLHIAQGDLARGRVAHMPDGNLALERSDLRAAKDLADQTIAAVAADQLAIRRCDPCSLLSPMLQCVQAEVGQVGCLRISEDPEHTALIVELVRPHRSQSAQVENVGCQAPLSASILTSIGPSTSRSPPVTPRTVPPTLSRLAGS